VQVVQVFASVTTRDDLAELDTRVMKEQPSKLSSGVPRAANDGDAH
jgi:hypothetical protein